ncbi:MAG TPA: ComF family protein [Ghiorsea sp.]|nr:ComF family protein [Ghiorsea sp.]HIP07521.1 ComF family protein [Mariprofundaceae bacterium]
MMKLSIKAAQHLQSLVFPYACVLCGDTMQSTQGCCASCLQDLKVMPKFSCLSCGIPLDASLAPGPCGTCLNKALPQQQTRHLYLYRGKVRDAILAWKLQGQDMGMQWLLQTATQQLTSIFSPHDLLIPVPMPLYRMRRSGLHHSADLCQNIAKLTGSRVQWQILRRKGDDKRQSSLHGKARQTNLHKAFSLADNHQDVLSSLDTRGKIWVIDDILTTGATLRHACRVMKQTKQPIFAFSFARTWQDS